jgi:hypothetical protein
MLGTLFSTSRSEPGHLIPAVGGTLVVAMALPVVALLGWSIAGWGLAAALWIGLHGLDFLLARARTSTSSASSGMQAFGLFFKLIALLVVLFAALAADRGVALAAVLTYGLAYTFELGLSLATYFGTAAR